MNMLSDHKRQGVLNSLAGQLGLLSPDVARYAAARVQAKQKSQTEKPNRKAKQKSQTEIGGGARRPLACAWKR
jgi:hypothetical protein